MVSAWIVVIGLAAVGFGLLMLELFVFPGFGIAGIAGILSILGAVFYAGTNEFMGLWYGVGVFAVTFILSLAAVIKVARGDAFARLQNRAVSPGSLGGKGDSVANSRPAVGDRGVALTQLHPAGMAKIGDRRCDVTVEGSIVEAGTAVEVIRVEGNLVRVIPV